MQRKYRKFTKEYMNYLLYELPETVDVWGYDEERLSDRFSARWCRGCFNQHRTRKKRLKKGWKLKGGDKNLIIVRMQEDGKNNQN